MPRKKTPDPAISFVPTPGTREFGEFVMEHFVSMVHALRDFIGEDAFGQYCIFVAGVQSVLPIPATYTQARGNVDVSIMAIASLIQLAALEHSKKSGIPRRISLSQIIARVQNEIELNPIDQF